MNPLQKSRLCLIGMFGGYALAILLAATLGRRVPMIFIVGIFVALGFYAAAIQFSNCPSCGKNLLYGGINGFQGVLNMFRLLFKAPITCAHCNKTVVPGDPH